MTKLDPYIALARAEGVLRRYPKFRAFCQAYRFDQHYLADIEIELAARNDDEERVKRVVRRMGSTVGEQIRALMSEELGNGKEPDVEHAEEGQEGGGEKGIYAKAPEGACGRQDEKAAEGAEPRGEGDATAGIE